MTKKLLATDSIWALAWQVFSNASGLILLLVFTNIYGSETYGAFMQVSLTMTLLAPIITLMLGNALTRYIASETDRHKRNQLFSMTLWTTLGISLILVPIVLLLKPVLSSLLFGTQEYIGLIFPLLLWIIAEALLLTTTS